MIAPLSGEIVEVNDALQDNPEKVNEDPYGDGWLVKVRLTAPEEAETLLGVAGIPQDAGPLAGKPAHPRSLALADVTRYTSATPDDRARDARRDRRLLGRRALRADPRAAAPRPAAGAARRDGRGRGLRAAGSAGRAQRRRRSAGLLRRRRDVRPLRAGDRRRDHLAQRVPHPVHALPAGDLPGRAAGDVRVPDGDVGADRAAGLQRRPLRGALLGRLGGLPGDGRDQARQVRRLPRRPPAQPRDARDLRGRLRRRGRRGRARGRADRRRGAGRGGRRRDRRGLPPEPELPRRGRGRRGARRGGEGARARCWSSPATR